MKILKGNSEQAAIWVVVVLFLSVPFMALMLANVPSAWASGPNGPAGSRAVTGILSKVPETRGKSLHGVDWRPRTDQAFIVGQGAVYMYNATTKNLTQLDGTESVDNYYEDLAWRPQGDYALIVGATPMGSKASGLIVKLSPVGSTWKVQILFTSVKYKLSSIDWAWDGSYAIIVGGAMGGENAPANMLMLRYSPWSGNYMEVTSDTTGPGLSNVAYNLALGKFYACGLSGRMMTYDGTTSKDITDPALKSIDLFAITWRDNGGRAMMGGWYTKALVGYVVTTDGTYNRIIQDPDMGLVSDADWAPRTDYTLFVGQNGGIWQYVEGDKAPLKLTPFDTKHYYGVNFNDDGNIGLIVGAEGDILRYDVSYPLEQNFPPEVYIVSPHNNDAFDYGKIIPFSSNSTHDDDLEQLSYTWTSSLDSTLSNQPYFSKNLSTGKHLITLAVSDTDSHITKATINVTVRPPTDVPSIDAGPYKIGYVGKDIDLEGRVVHSGYNIKTYEWDCAGTGQFKTTNGPRTQCNYAKVGKYNATFRVTDVRLAVAIRKAVVTVFPPLSDANITTMVNVTNKAPLQKGDYLIFSVNATVSTSIELFVVPPKGADVQTLSIHFPPSKPFPNGTYNVTWQVPGNQRPGEYRIKWRYLDQNGTRTDWYVTKPDFEVKKYNEDGTGSLMAMIAAIIVVIVLVVIAIVVVVMYMLKRSVTKLEAAVLFYQDGRVIQSYIPPETGPKAAPPPQPPATPPQAPPPAPPVQVAYGQPPQYAAPAGAAPMQSPTPQYPAQPTQQYPPQPVPQAPQPAPVVPTNAGTAQVHAVVQDAINSIRQGTAHRLPDKVVEGLRTIYLEQGQHTILAVAVTGPDLPSIRKGMKNALQEIEIVYGNQLRKWDGLIADMPRIQAIIEKEVKVRD
jgi:hypothetical protein